MSRGSIGHRYKLQSHDPRDSWRFVDTFVPWPTINLSALIATNRQACAQLQTFCYPTTSKTFRNSNSFTVSTNFAIQKHDRQTKNIKIVSYPQCANSKPQLLAMVMGEAHTIYAPLTFPAPMNTFEFHYWSARLGEYTQRHSLHNCVPLKRNWQIKNKTTM